MGSLWKKAAAVLTGPLLAALLLAAGFLAFVTWDQSHWWRVKEDYSFGWLVPAFVAFAIYDRWPKIVAAVAACGGDASPRAGGWQKWLLRLVISGLLIFGVLMFLLGSFYRAGAGTSQPGTLAITLSAIGILLPLLWLNTPDSAEATSGRPDAPPHARGTIFPTRA